MDKYVLTGIALALGAVWFLGGGITGYATGLFSASVVVSDDVNESPTDVVTQALVRSGGGKSAAWAFEEAEIVEEETPKITTISVALTEETFTLKNDGEPTNFYIRSGSPLVQVFPAKVFLGVGEEIVVDFKLLTDEPGTYEIPLYVDYDDEQRTVLTKFTVRPTEPVVVEQPAEVERVVEREQRMGVNTIFSIILIFLLVLLGLSFRMEHRPI